MTQEKILVIQLRQLGDILLTTPCFRAIKKERPRAMLTFLSHRMGSLIVDQNPFVDEHFFYDEKDGTLPQLRIARSLRERRFDLVLDFMNNPRSAIFSMASGGQERLAFRSARRFAYTRCIDRPAPGRYIVQDKFDLLRSAGFQPEDDRLVLPWDIHHTRPLMRLWGLSPELVRAPLRVILSPTHRRPQRRWPLIRYARVADYLVQHWNASVMWLWGPGEEGIIDEALTLCCEPTLKAPKTSFREMAALVANMDLFIGNSNGPSHVAVATGICSLQLHGHTAATSWCPMTARHRAIQSSEYGKKPQPSMEAITLEETLAVLTEMRPLVEEFHQIGEASRPRSQWKAGVPELL